MKKVLFPFEIGHECYREAYVYAIKVTRNLGAELIMLNTFEIEVDNTITEERYENLKKKNWIIAHQEVLRFHDYYLNNHARVDFELRVRADYRFYNGKLIEEFRDIIHNEDIDLVVLPATSKSESTRKILKLMRRDVLNKNHMSLLAIPCESDFQNIDHLLLIAEPKFLNSPAMYMEEITLFAQVFYSAVHAVQLSRQAEETREEEEKARIIARFPKSMAQRVSYHRIKGSDPDTGLLEYMSENHISLMAISRQQKHMIGRIFHSDTLEEMCSTFGIPVLILKDGPPD